MFCKSFLNNLQNIIKIQNRLCICSKVNPNILKIINTIQNNSLQYITGAFCSSPLENLYNYIT